MTNKENKLNGKQLDEVIGGAIHKDSGSNGKTNEECEPRFYKYSVKDKGIVTYLQKPMCSDTLSKGFKPECAYCVANIQKD